MNTAVEEWEESAESSHSEGFLVKENILNPRTRRGNLKLKYH